MKVSLLLLSIAVSASLSLAEKRSAASLLPPGETSCNTCVRNAKKRCEWLRIPSYKCTDIVNNVCREKCNPADKNTKCNDCVDFVKEEVCKKGQDARCKQDIDRICRIDCGRKGKRQVLPSCGECWKTVRQSCWFRKGKKCWKQGMKACVRGKTCRLVGNTRKWLTRTPCQKCRKAAYNACKTGGKGKRFCRRTARKVCSDSCPAQRVIRAVDVKKKKSQTCERVCRTVLHKQCIGHKCKDTSLKKVCREICKPKPS